MLYRIIRRILFIYDSLMSVVACYWLRSAGIRLGKNAKCYGIPMISIRKGSKIIIGDFAILRSISRGNAIGINHRIVFTSHSPDACIEIGNHVGMSGGAICCKKHVKIGDYTLLGANTTIADSDIHPIKPESRSSRKNDADIPAKEIIIGNNVWVGADVFICKGVSIGDNSVIGAKSLVTKSIPANSIAAGNPAVVIKAIS